MEQHAERLSSLPSPGIPETAPFRAAGRENDGTGLYYYRARYYNPGRSRFVSEDPIGFVGGDVNVYTYASNVPLVYIDPLGLYTVEELASVIYNETAPLQGPATAEARQAVGHVAVNREARGITGGIAPAQLTERERRAIRNRVPGALQAWEQSLNVAAEVLDECGADPTSGATEFNLRGNPSRSPRRGVPVLLQYGPFENRAPTVSDPRVPIREQLPASGVYINIFGVPRR